MKKRSKKVNLPFKEGTWFAVPLREGGYAVGRIARHSPKGEIILAYFFGPKRETVPALGELEQVAPDSAIKIAKVGALGIMDGSWPIIGDVPTWERARWPIPAFIRRDDISKIAWRVVYADDNPNQVISEERIPYESSGYGRDVLHGAGAAEIVLTQLLS